MTIIPHVPNSHPVECPLDDDVQLQKLYRKELKHSSKLYRELLESMVRELDTRGNIQCFAFTLNVLPESITRGFSRLTAVEPDNNRLVHGSSFCFYVDAIIHTLHSIDLLECIFITQEFHTEGELKGLPHYHVFLAVRSLFGTEGDYLIAALQAFLVNTYSDFQLRKLNTFLDKKRYLNYMVKGEKLYYHIFYAFSSITERDFESYFYRIARKFEYSNWGGPKMAPYLQLPTTTAPSKVEFDSTGQPMQVPHGYLIAYPDIQEFHKRHAAVSPPPAESITVDTLLYALYLYCYFNSYFLCKEALYRRREGSRFSYELVFTLEALLNDLTPVYHFLSKEFPFQFKYAENYVKQGFMRFIPDVMARIRKSDVGMFPTVQLNYHLVEFRNGIYNKRIGQFLEFSNYPENRLVGLPFNCYLYFDRYFKGYSSMLPHRWLSLLRPQFDSDEELNAFCARFAVLFHGDSIHQRFMELDKNDRALYVEGVSNSGKTRLLADVVRAIVGPENVGLLGSSDQFPLETAVNKQALVLDEYRYRPSQRDILLRMLDGTPIPLDRKHKAQEIVSIIAPVLILANIDRNQSMLTDEAFQNRLRHYRFNLVVGESGTAPLDAVKEELYKIFLYCNQLFLKQYGQHFPEIRDLYKQTRSRKPFIKRLHAQGFLLASPDSSTPSKD